MKSIRLKEYDYTNPNWYYVTICSHNKKFLLGEINKGKMKLNDFGKVINNFWNEIPDHFPNVELDYYVIMPDHIHGIIIINERNNKTVVEAQHAAPLQENNKIKSGSLGVIVRSFKSASSRQINLNRNEKIKIWQPNYYEHIVRNEKELYCIRKYIEENPLKWEFKNHFPENLDL